MRSSRRLTTSIALNTRRPSANVMATIGMEKVIRYYIYMTVVNAFAAVAFTAPVISPELAFPLKLTIWPGTWMFIAYFVFLIVGVLGTLGWAVLLDLLRRTMGTESCDRFLAISSIVLIEVAVYVEASFMFTVGYIGGGNALAGQIGPAVNTYIIGPLVVPI